MPAGSNALLGIIKEAGADRAQPPARRPQSRNGGTRGPADRIGKRRCAPAADREIPDRRRLRSSISPSKPVAKKLRPFMDELRPLARDARPTLLRPRLDPEPARRGTTTRLELTNLQVPLRDATVGEVRRNGEKRDGAFQATTQALHDYIPEDRLRAPLRPGRARLVRRLQPLRHLRRAGAPPPASAFHASAFALANGQLSPVPPELRDEGVHRRRRPSTSATAARAPPSTRPTTGPTRGSPKAWTATRPSCSGEVGPPRAQAPLHRPAPGPSPAPVVLALTGGGAARGTRSPPTPSSSTTRSGSWRTGR